MATDTTLGTRQTMRIQRRLIPAFMLAAIPAFSVPLSAADAKAKPGKWEVLFDGKSVEKWRGYKMNSFPDHSWKVEAGAIKTIAGAEGPDIVTKEKFENFELELEWKVSPGANSGIMYRVSEDSSAPFETGPEMQVLDDDKHADGQDPKTSAGSLYALIAPKNKKLKPVGEWNQVRIVAQGNQVEYWLHGVKVVAFELVRAELKPLIQSNNFKHMPRLAS